MILFELNIEEEKDIVAVRQKSREAAVNLNFSFVDQTRIITAASELSRNIYQHAIKGRAIIEKISEGIKNGIMITFEDEGPGIRDIYLAMKNGYSTTKSLGLGLSGSKRLMDEFEIYSTIGKGTKVIIKKWL
ncbi:MAG: anti-sigma regulatory factor [Ruminiclostridium sp.]|nr:anti-sigma regulatory factor [Ruminiclostridium sp.]